MKAKKIGETHMEKENGPETLRSPLTLRKPPATGGKVESGSEGLKNGKHPEQLAEGKAYDEEFFNQGTTAKVGKAVNEQVKRALRYSPAPGIDSAVKSGLGDQENKF